MTGVSYHPVHKCSECVFQYMKNLLCSETAIHTSYCGRCIFIEFRGHNEYHQHVHRYLK